MSQTKLFTNYQDFFATATKFGQVSTVPLCITWEDLGSKVQELEISMNIQWKSTRIFYSEVVYTGLCVVDDLAVAVFPPNRDSAWAAQKRWGSLRQVLEQALELRMRTQGLEAGKCYSPYRDGLYDMPPDRWLIGDGEVKTPDKGLVQLECLTLVYWTDSYPHYVTNYMTYSKPLDRQDLSSQEPWRYF